MLRVPRLPIVEKLATMMQPLGSLLLLTVLAMQPPPTAEPQGLQPEAADARPAAVAPEPVDPLIIQRAARQYRMQLYHSFRLQRAEYDRRRAAWDEVLAAWQAAGSRADQQHLLLAWLQAAIKSASPDTFGPLPAIPVFQTAEEPAPLPPEPLPVILTKPAPAVPEQKLHLHPSPAVEVHLDQQVWPISARRSASNQLSQPSVPLPSHPVLPKRERPTWEGWDEPLGDAPTVVEGRFSFLSTAPRSELPGVDERELADVVSHKAGTNAVETVKESSSAPIQKVSEATMQALPVAEAPPVVASPIRPLLPRRGTVVEREAPRVARSTPSFASIPRRMRRPADFDQLPGLDKSELQSLSSPPPQPAPSRLSVPVVPQTTEPHRLVPLPAPAPVATIPPPRRPIAPSPTTKEPVRPSAVLVDRTELSARILGGNLALRECEAALDNDKPWDAAQLGPLVARLQRLCIQRHDCLLLCDLLPESERSLIGTFDAPQPVIRILSKRIVEARHRARSPAFSGTDTQRAAELRALDTHAQTVADLTRKWSVPSGE